MKENKACQSCGMPLKLKKQGDMRGTEKDNIPSQTYCKYCYQNGEFTKPDITIDEMQKWGKKKMKEDPDLGPILKKIMPLLYSKRFIKRLSRWK